MSAASTASPPSAPVMARASAVRTGVQRGWIEFRQTMTTPGDVITNVVLLGSLVAAMLWTRTVHLPGTTFSLGTTMMASVLGMDVGFTGVALLCNMLAVEHEDGTLLRAKAVPHGMSGYLVGKVVCVTGTVLIEVASLLVVGALLFSGLRLGSAHTWLTLAWVLVLGLLATLPMGAILGSVLPNAGRAGLAMVVLSGLIAISGIFYPITHLPHWLQYVGQVFPMYWLGLGMRSALLPHALASVEIGHSWRTPLTALVLLGWAVFGLAVAPLVLRRMARRESGSRVAARRELALRRMP
jgi:ABC-2 type transport system permease protein